MMEQPRPVGDILTEYSKHPEQQSAKLAGLSHLSSEESRTYREIWVKMKTEDRRKIISRLIELAEDNVELNFDSIFRSCLEDPDAGVRTKAIEGLWENEETSLISPLLKILSNDPDEDARAAAAAALGKFTLLAEYGKIHTSYTTLIQDNLLSVIHNTGESEAVRRRALEAIAPLSISEVTRSIREAYQSQSPRMKVSALYAMGKNCDPVWVPVLIQELSNNDAEIRYEAAGALGEIGEETAVPYLIKLGNDPDAEVQAATIQALGKIGGTRAKEYLLHLLETKNQAIHEAAQQALNELKAGEDPLSLQI